MAGCTDNSDTDQPIAVKVVVVTMFEIGELTGDKAGEFQLWKERRNLNQRFPFHGYKDLYYNEDSGILGIVTGIGTARAAAAIMALGMDTRFDLSKSYWLIVGIAGFDPADASIGSAAWAEYLVDGDLAHEIDAREIPADWDFGYFARYTRMPFDPDKPDPTGEMYHLNANLVDWAYQLTKDIDLGDDESLLEVRERYTGHEMARKPPFVLKGDNIASLTFWHGKILNDWANQWVHYWTEGKGEFVSAAMEDTGTYLSLSWLHKIGRADINRVMVLRTASNYTMQPPGMTAVENLLKENEGYGGLGVAIESAYIVGSRVVDEILNNWETYENTIPGR
ncbi:MAG: purine nucleoside permease [Proteobacteria bacterium]|nr:purine nucleoside permease [Pseudomonadota bacterium]